MLFSKWRPSGRAAVTIGLGTLVFGGITVLQSADHIDAPVSSADAPADINDLFVFTSPENASNVVFAITMNPLIPPTEAAAASFDPNVLYQWKIDTNADGAEDMVLQARVIGDGGQQTLVVRGPSTPQTTGTMSMELDETPLISGRVSSASDTEVIDQDGVRAFAGVRDDPFYIDLTRLTEVLSGTQSSFRNPGVDALAGVNTLAIVIELPKSMLGGSSDIGVWATSSRAN